MPTRFDNPDHLLRELEAAKGRFDANHAPRISKLLSRISALELTDPHHLIRFHEALLFLRAFPHSRALVVRIEKILDTFHQRVDTLCAVDADMSVFDDFDTSGIAGTTMQDTLSFDVARWLAQRAPNNVDIAWDNYWDDHQAERARGATWPRFIPLLEEDADVEADVPWQRWLDAARGRQGALSWLLSQFAKLPLPPRQQAELYESLRLPIRWKLENLKLSRTRNFARPRQLYFHDAPLIQRSEVFLAQELAKPAPRLEKLSAVSGRSVINSLREFMAVRYRDLYGATLGDSHSVVRGKFGRGTVLHLWGLPPDRRLPLRAYVCGFTLKNGVPINYFEAIGLCEWIEVGFNTFYTYRQGETAWIYAQALRCLGALTGAKVFSIYPYQIGLDNDEAIDSGAFWFYRKLGFRSGRSDLQELCVKEERKIAANHKYRTSRQILKRLAEAHMFYEFEPSSSMIAKARAIVKERPFQSRLTPSAKKAGFDPHDYKTGSWDSFSTRTLGLRVNRRMAQRFDSASQKIRRASTTAVTEMLRINLARWTQSEKAALENWSLILALIPTLASWTRAERDQLIKIIRAKSAPSEMSYLRETQRHSRLRTELLRLGSSSA